MKIYLLIVALFQAAGIVNNFIRLAENDYPRACVHGKCTDMIEIVTCGALFLLACFFIWNM